MKEIVIVSGKGGTGKTSITGAFATLAERAALCDADVDAADLHLLLQPNVKEQYSFMGGHLAIIDSQRCNQCGRCLELCQFSAISNDFKVRPLSCEGCGVCVDLCPEQAIDFPEQESGKWFISDTQSGPMVHARLGIGQENSGKLVSLIRTEARQLAEERELDLLITDGPPGIGCPVIATLTGADRAVIIVEPTVSGLHDTQRLTQLIHHFKLKALLCVNRYDINIDKTDEIESFAKKQGITILPRLPFDRMFVEALIAGKTVTEPPFLSTIGQKVKEVWQSVIADLDTTAPAIMGIPISK